MATYQGSSCNWGYGYRQQRSKVDWAGVCLGDAFKANLDYFVKLPAQRLFYEAVRVVQEAAAQAAGEVVDGNFQPQTKAQIAPYFTSYPSNLSAFAALGLTGYLEFSKRVSERTLVPLVESRLHERLLLTELGRADRLASVEYYRLFLASQQSLQFESVPTIVRSVAMFGDLLPDWRRLPLHGMTRALLRDVSDASAPYLQRLETAEPARMLTLGLGWVEALCHALLPYLPRRDDEVPQPRTAGGVPLPPSMSSDDRFRFGDPDRPPPRDDDPRIPPLNAPRPPSLFDPEQPQARLEDLLRKPPAQDEQRLMPPGPMDPDAESAMREFSAAVSEAGGQSRNWEDMRSDLLEEKMRTGGFSEGPIEGMATDGHSVTVPQGNNEAGGELFDRPVELSTDQDAFDKLSKEADPVRAALRRALYPNVQQSPHTDRFQTTGSAFDAAKLPVAEICAASYKRYRVTEQLDRRGRPVLLIACDGSASLDARQMRMTKILAGAWIQSTIGSRIQVLAGLYHSGEVRDNQTGPLVQWMAHPQKTPSSSPADAARAVVTLPDNGTGIQSDALSITFMVEEARKVARGSTVYLILVSDCAWNPCFHDGRDGREEVDLCLEGLREQFGDRLHITLVALGIDEAGTTGVDERVDKVIKVPDADLTDPAKVAKHVGEYVATCMRERRRYAIRN